MSIKISIVFIRNDQPLPKAIWEEGMALLPHSVQQTIEKYHFWKDRQARLMSKLLQTHILDETIPGMQFSDIKYGAYKKPYIDQNMAFNLSHAGDYVVCASAPYCEALGIDIELITDYNCVEDYKAIFTAAEWKHLLASPDPLVTFYHLWTLKESASKADGRGLHIPLDQIMVQENSTVIDAKHWFYEKINIAEGYICHLSLSSADYEITVEEKSIYEVVKGQSKIADLL